MIDIGMHDPLGLLLVAALNPVVAIVGFLMGRQSDQWPKLLIAGFAAALAGAVIVWLSVEFGLLGPRIGIGAGGNFVFSLVVGTAWAALGYALRKGGATR